MLFKASITSKTTKDKEKLAEQLYIFLEEFIKVRLRYESEQEKEDCTQDTIMHLFNRFSQLTPEEVETINLEQYFYNRANSYITYWLRNKYLDRNKLKTYAENLAYLNMDEAEERTEIDYKLLNSIIDSYSLATDTKSHLRDSVIYQLTSIGFIDNREDSLKLLPYIDSLVIVIVDEYLIREAG